MKSLDSPGCLLCAGFLPRALSYPSLWAGGTSLDMQHSLPQTSEQGSTWAPLLGSIKPVNYVTWQVEQAPETSPKSLRLQNRLLTGAQHTKPH